MKIWFLCGILLLITPVSAQPAPSIEQLMREWASEPEDPEMRAPCAPQLEWATKIDALYKRGASVTQFLRWAEAESEKTEIEASFDPPLAFGAEIVLMHLINRWKPDKQMYAFVRGGFPQWVYRSCLKGKDLGS